MMSVHQSCGGEKYRHSRRAIGDTIDIKEKATPAKTGKSKKKKNKADPKKWMYWRNCPFCFEERKPLPDKSIRMYPHRENFCRKCGAKEVDRCPACGRKTWQNVDGVHKHNNHGCGFVGKKLYNDHVY